jgi:hypothetical protein
MNELSFPFPDFASQWPIINQSTIIVHLRTAIVIVIVCMFRRGSPARQVHILIQP